MLNASLFFSSASNFTMRDHSLATTGTSACSSPSLTAEMYEPNKNGLFNRFACNAGMYTPLLICPELPLVLGYFQIPYIPL
ncbi:MAG: hypothetical protein ACLRZ2_05405 [Veillonella sp.]